MIVMTELKYFIKSGNQYTMKRQHGFGLIVIVGLVAATVASVYAQLPAAAWICGALTILFALAILLRRVEIDMGRSVLFVKGGLLAPGVSIPFADFVHFELASVKQNFITINTSLNIRYLKNGKEKAALVAQGFTVKAMQNILNEIETITQPNAHPEKV